MYTIYVPTRTAYRAALRAWAAKTFSEPDRSRWEGPGWYEQNGYMDDDNRPMVTLERKERQ